MILRFFFKIQTIKLRLRLKRHATVRLSITWHISHQDSVKQSDPGLSIVRPGWDIVRPGGYTRWPCATRSDPAVGKNFDLHPPPVESWSEGHFRQKKFIESRLQLKNSYSTGCDDMWYDVCKLLISDDIVKYFGDTKTAVRQKENRDRNFFVPKVALGPTLDRGGGCKSKFFATAESLRVAQPCITAGSHYISPGSHYTKTRVALLNKILMTDVSCDA